jgi:anti-anti-sigma factor
VPLSLDRHVEGGTLHIELAGEIDLATRATLADAVEAAFDRQDITRVVVDVAEVTFMDCFGMSALLHGRALADKKSWTFEVRNPTGIVHTVMRLTGVLDYLSGR